MSFEVFYRKWRPQTFAEVVGQEPITRTLRRAVESNRVVHAYLFCGPRGTGKTSMARILAKAVNCPNQTEGEPCNACELCRSITEGSSLDIIEIDAASNRGIEDIRSLREKINYVPSLAKYKVYIIDEVHMLTEFACNALLKTLEEPPAHAIFVLATTEAHKILPTIISRCQRFDFQRLSQKAIVSKLNSICQKEEVDIDTNSLKLIAHAATGSLRDAENILQQLIAYHGNKIAFEQVQMVMGSSCDSRVGQLVQCIVDRDISGGLRIINEVNDDGIDLNQFNQGLVEYFRELLLSKSGYEDFLSITTEDRNERAKIASAVTLSYLLKATKIFANVEFHSDNYSSLPLEIALADCILSSQDERKKTFATKNVEEERSSESPEISLSQSPQRQESLSSTGEAESEHNAVTGQGEPGQTRDFYYLCSRWAEFVQSLRGKGSRGSLDALLRNACKPVALEDGTLTLGFYHSFHKESVEEAKCRHLIEERLGEVFGKPYKIHCILVDSKKGISSQPIEYPPLVKAAIDMGAVPVNINADQ
ncbi:MAG: DNA polymerase III subunit gamma/tau [Dehalococcoidia bacterium]|nr:DNA polymerase III subunit gamma/tau [Dehalococcoidia bacterium]